MPSDPAVGIAAPLSLLPHWVKLQRPALKPLWQNQPMNIQKRKRLLLSLAAGFAITAHPAFAEVVDAAKNGFTVRHSVVVDAGRAATYGVAVDNFAEWWSAAHSFTGVADNLYVTAKPFGCFCEKLGEDGGVIHMTVTFVNPGTMLRLTGGLGPLGLLGVDGNMTWEFDDAAAGGTRVTITYAVGGYMAEGLDSVAPAVDGVITEQLERLRARILTGEDQNATVGP